MTTPGSAFQALMAGLRATVAGVLAAVLALAGFAFMLFALAVGAALALGLTGWALLHGRRPQGIRFGVPPGTRFRSGRPARRSTGVVVDVEARDVTPR